MIDNRAERLVRSLSICDLVTPNTWFVGRSPSLQPLVMQRNRVLDAAAIRRELGSIPTLCEDGLLDVLDDQSGSMWSGNDARGLRDEAALIAVEHLARRRSLSQSRWHLRVTTFDQNSPMELSVTRLDSKGLRAAQQALLNRSPGGSSKLGPALRSVEASGFAGRRFVVVMSDFELFDPDVAQVLSELIASSADSVLALVFGARPPLQLTTTRVHVASIDPSTCAPAAVAHEIVDFVRAAMMAARVAGEEGQ